MYNDHYGFRCTPFDDRADTQFTYVTPDLEEVLAGLEYEARFGKGVALVLGEAGVGKTQTLRALLLRLHSTDHAVVVSVPPSGEFDPIREACKGFGVSLPSSGGQLSRRMARLRRHLSRNTQAGHRSILILDQGENLTSAGLSQLATLTELQDEHGRLLCVFLFGQPRLQRQLEAPEFARLLQQFTGERYLHPLSAEQTAEYIRHRLRVAGAGDPELIDPEALHLIFAASNGVPRLINHFTNEALVTAYAAGSSCVTAAMVDEVIGATESRTRSARLEDLGLQPARMGSGGGLSAQPTPRTAQRAPQPVQRAARTERMTTTPPISSASRETSRDDWDVERVPAETFGTPTAFEGPGVVVSAAAPAALSNSLETLFSQGSDLLERLERVLAKAERTCSVSDASLTQHAAVEKHLSTLSAGAERVLRSLTDGVDQAQRTMREAPRRLEEALLASESRLAQVDGKIAAISQIEERAGQRSGRIETLQRQVADAEERLQDVLRELEAKAESASQQSKRMTDDLVATSRVRPDAERIIARLTEQAKELAEQAKESDARAASIEVRERRSAERTRELRAELEALDAKATTVIESVGRELEGLVASARERVQAQLGELKRSEDIVGRVEVSLQPIAEKATSRFREQIASLQQAAVEGLRGTLETLSRKREDVSGLLLELEAGARTLQTRSDEAVARIEATTEPVVQRTAARCREQLQEQATTLQRLYEEKLAAGLVEHRARVEEVLTSTQHRTEESRLVIEGVERRQRSLEMAIAPLSDKVSNAAIAVSGLNEKADGLGEKARGLTETVDRLGQTVAAIHTAAGTEVAQVETLSDRASTMKGELNEAVERAREILAETEVAEGTVATIRQTVSASVREMTQAAERVGTLREKVAAWEQTAVRIERDVAVGQACADDLNSATESAAEIRRALQALTTESAERVGQLDSHNASASRVRNELAEANAAANVALQRIEADRRTLEGLVRDANGATERFTVAQVTGAETVAQLDELVEIAQSAYRRADDAVAEVEIRTATLSTGCKDAEGVLQRISQCERSTSQIVEKANQTSQHAEKTAAATASTVDRLLKEVWSLTGKTETTAKQLEAAHSRSSELLGKLTQAAGPADAVVQKLSKQLAEADRHYQRIARDAQEAQKLAERVASVTQVLAGARDAEASIQQTASDVLSLQDRFAALVTQAAQQSVSLRELLASIQTMTAEQTQARGEAEVIMHRLDDHRSTTQAAAQAGEELLREFLAQSESLEGHLKELGHKIAEVETGVRQALSQRDETVDQAKTQTAQLERVGDAVRKVFAAVSQATLEARDRAKELTGVNQTSVEKIAVFTAETQRATDTLHEWVREAVRAQERLERTLRTVPAIQQTHPRESMLAGLTRSTTSLPGTTDAGTLGELRSVAAPAVKEPIPGAAPMQRTPHRVGRAGEIAQLIEDAKKATVEAK